MLDVEGALTAAAGRAFRLTRFYADMYEAEPGDASEIPFIGGTDYNRAAGLLDCVVDREAIIGILPPYYRDASRFPFTVPEDEAELILRQRRIVRAMKDLGVNFGMSPRFLIVADGRRGPFACEIAKGFYWEGFQTSITFGSGAADELRQEVVLHDPDYVVLVSGRHLRHAVDRARESVWLVEHCGDTPLDAPEYPTLLYADGVDLVGSRPAGRTVCDFDREQLLIEVNPASLLSHASKLMFTCFPLIRYALGRRVPTDESLTTGAF
jgi:hypothetical protein